ncbi:hypothetical protein [Streptomyces sp. NPDC054863]
MPTTTALLILVLLLSGGTAIGFLVFLTHTRPQLDAPVNTAIAGVVALAALLALALAL